MSRNGFVGSTVQACLFQHTWYSCARPNCVRKLMFQKPGDHPNFRKNGLGVKRPFSELSESSGAFLEFIGVVPAQKNVCLVLSWVLHGIATARASDFWNRRRNHKDLPQWEANLATFHRKTHRNRNHIATAKQSPPRIWTASGHYLQLFNAGGLNPPNIPAYSFDRINKSQTSLKNHRWRRCTHVLSPFHSTFVHAVLCWISFLFYPTWC